MIANPFKPTAGKTPPLLIGRQEILDDFRYGIEDGLGAPGRLMRITGARGSGKTVLLNALGTMAREHSWDVIHETASDGMCDRIRKAVLAAQPVDKATIRANLGIVSADVAFAPQQTDSLRAVLTPYVQRLTSRDAGLLITIDEVQDASEDDMRTIAHAVQHLIREDQSIALVFAGITSGVLRIIDGKAMTFLRRALAEELLPIPVPEVAQALRETIETSGLAIADKELEQLARATRGYPYMIQLAGYRVFRCARNHAERDRRILTEDVELGLAQARREFESAVIEVSIGSLSRAPMQFLLAMAADDGPSSIAAIGERLGKSVKSLSPTRQLLISEQVIEPVSHGYLTFSVPYLHEYLRGHRDKIEARFGL